MVVNPSLMDNHQLEVAEAGPDLMFDGCLVTFDGFLVALDADVGCFLPTDLGTA